MGRQWKVNATLFFVAVYFKILANLLDFDDDLTQIDLGILERIFRAFDLNKQVLELTDRVVDEFMKDSQVFKKTKTVMQMEGKPQTLFDYPTFFKTHAYKEEFQDMLKDKISLIFSSQLGNLKKQILDLPT